MKILTLRRLAAGAAVLAVGAIVVPPSSASAATIASPSLLAVSNGVYYDDCVDAPYSLDALNSWSQQAAEDWGNVYGFYNYDLDLKVIGADGSEAAHNDVTRMDDEVSNATGYDPGSFYLCNRPGTYKIQASGWWCPLDETPEDSLADCKTIAALRI